jgi:hypothetical protein
VGRPRLERVGATLAPTSREEATMITLDLTQPEYIVLKQIVDNKIPALLNELAHTDDRSYREYLKETLGTVEQLNAKLDLSLTKDLQPHA